MEVIPISGVTWILFSTIRLGRRVRKVLALRRRIRKILILRGIRILLRRIMMLLRRIGRLLLLRIDEWSIGIVIVLRVPVRVRDL